MIDALMDIFSFPIEKLKLSRCEMITTLNYHRRLERIANPDVESSCGPVSRMLLVSPAGELPARYVGYVLAGQQIIERIS